MKIRQGSLVAVRNGDCDQLEFGTVCQLRLGRLYLSSANSRVAGVEVFVNGQWVAADECDFTGVIDLENTHGK